MVFIRVLTAFWRPIPGMAIFFWVQKIAVPSTCSGLCWLVSLTKALVVMATYPMFRLIQAMIPWDSLFFFRHPWVSLFFSRFGHAVLDLCGHLPRVFLLPCCYWAACMTDSFNQNSALSRLFVAASFLQLVVLLPDLRVISCQSAVNIGRSGIRAAEIGNHVQSFWRERFDNDKNNKNRKAVNWFWETFKWEPIGLVPGAQN